MGIDQVAISQVWTIHAVGAQAFREFSAIVRSFLPFHCTLMFSTCDTVFLCNNGPVGRAKRKMARGSQNLRVLATRERSGSLMFASVLIHIDLLGILISCVYAIDSRYWALALASSIYS